MADLLDELPSDGLCRALAELDAAAQWPPTEEHAAPLSHRHQQYLVAATE